MDSRARSQLSLYSRDALVQRADALSVIFGECVREYKQVARAADGHVSDKLTVEEAWPR